MTTIQDRRDALIMLQDKLSALQGLLPEIALYEGLGELPQMAPIIVADSEADQPEADAANQ